MLFPKIIQAKSKKINNLRGKSGFQLFPLIIIKNENIIK